MKDLTSRDRGGCSDYPTGTYSETNPGTDRDIHKLQEQITRDSQCAANTHVQQVVNTAEVKTLIILKKTVQGEKVDPDDDQSHKDQSDDQTDRDSSDSLLSSSRSPEFRKSHSKSRTRKDQPKIGNLKTRSSSEQLNKL